MKGDDHIESLLQEELDGTLPDTDRETLATLVASDPQIAAERRRRSGFDLRPKRSNCANSGKLDSGSKSRTGTEPSRTSAKRCNSSVP